jgi:hypothetical protein
VGVSREVHVKHLLFSAFALGGFFLVLVVLGVAFPGFPGEVFSPTLIPFIGMVCIVGFSVPCSLVQSRVILSETSNRIAPLAYGFLWMPCFLYLGTVFKALNSWGAAYTVGLLSALMSFIISLSCVKIGDVLYQNMKKKEA